MIEEGAEVQDVRGIKKKWIVKEEVVGRQDDSFIDSAAHSPDKNCERDQVNPVY